MYLAKKTGRNIESFALSILCNKWKVLSSFNELSKPIIIIIWDLFYMRACEGIHKQKRNVEKKMKIVFIAKNCKSVKRLRSFHSFFLAFFGLHWLIKSREWNKLHIPLFFTSFESSANEARLNRNQYNSGSNYIELQKRKRKWRELPLKEIEWLSSIKYGFVKWLSNLILLNSRLFISSFSLESFY